MSVGVLAHELSVLWLGAFLGALVTGVGGFGFALVASAVWLHRLPAVETTMLVVACSALVHVWTLWPIRRAIEFRRLRPFVLGAAIGIPLGVRLLTTLDVATVKDVLGTLLLAYGLYALCVRRIPVVGRGGTGADAAVGFVGGVLGGLAGLSGVVPTIWTQMRGWPRDVARGVYQPFILLAQIATLLLLLLYGAGMAGLELTLAATPALVCGSWAGWKLYGHVNEAGFRRTVAALIALSGASLTF